MPYKPVNRNIKVKLGVAIDSTDFVTEENAIAYNAAGLVVEAILEKADGTIYRSTITPTDPASSPDQDYDWKFIGRGTYELELPASGGGHYNNGSLGILTVHAIATGVLPFQSVSYDIVPEDVYDAIVRGTDNLHTNVQKIVNDSGAAAGLKDLAGVGYDAVNHKLEGVKLADTTTDVTNDVGITAGAVDNIWDEGLTGASHNVPTSAGRRLRELAGSVVTADTCQSGSTVNTIVLASGASATDGAYDPSLIAIVGGTGSGQCRLVLQYTGSSRTAVVDRNWKTTPDNTSEYVVYADAGREHVNEGQAQAGAAGTITLNALASSSDDAYKNQFVYIRSGTGEDQARRVVSYNGTTKIVTVSDNWDVNPDATSAYIMIPFACVEVQAVGGTELGSNVGGNLDTFFDDSGSTATVVSDIDGLATSSALSTHDGKLDTVDANVDSILTDTGTTIPAQITSVHSTTDGLITTVDGNVDSILTDTTDMQPKLGTPVALDGGAATLGGMLTKMADDNGGADYDAGTDSLQEIRDRGDAAWTTGGGASSNPTTLQTTTIATLASQTGFTLTAGSADDNAYNNCLIVVTDASTSTQKCVGVVNDYTGSTRTIALQEDPAVFTMAAGDAISIIADIGLKALDNRTIRNANFFFQNNDADTTKVVADVGVAGSGYDPDTKIIDGTLTMSVAVKRIAQVVMGTRTMSADEEISHNNYDDTAVEVSLKKSGNTVTRTLG